MPAPCVLIDDATPGRERLMRFSGPAEIVRADDADEVPAALERLGRARNSGRHVAGYFSYELGYVLEPRLRPLLQRERPVPLLWFGLFDAPEMFEGAEAEAHLRWESHGRAYAGLLAHEWSAQDYAGRFAQARELIAAGDIYQANLSFRSRFAFAGDPLALYARLRKASLAAHGAFIEDGERAILSLSPELFFDLSADGRIVARPMKGTAARGSDAQSDLLARRRLADSTKDRAENLMIVDLLRNDLSRIAAPGSVDVEGLFAIETYPTLHQMVSTVTARMRPELPVAEIVRALFPCGSITGAPKIRAMEIIRWLEQSPRGVYCGAIGHFAPDGSARFNVAIRTATIEGARGELGIGGAVVHDSDCAGEHAECLLKARYFEQAREPLHLIETLAFRPGEGIVRRDLHLSRLERSAHALGLPFDRNAAEAALAEAVSSATAAKRLRLTLDEEGRIAWTLADLPPSPRSWTYAISDLRVEGHDALARHKTSWRAHLDSEQARLSAELGCDEVIFLNGREEVAEASRSNVFVELGGELLTPPLSSGALDGCLRRELVEAGRCREAIIRARDLETADAVFLGNSLRGLIRAAPVADARTAANS